MNGWKVYGILLTIAFGGFLFYEKGPVPFKEDGHASYQVVDEKAGNAVLQAMKLGGLKEKFTFDSGPTHQCLLSDGKTVLMWLDQEEVSRGGTGNARSLVVDNPREAAAQAAKMLIATGYTAEIQEPPMSDLGENKLVLVKTNAMVNGCLVFRRHVLSMGSRPVERNIDR